MQRFQSRVRDIRKAAQGRLELTGQKNFAVLRKAEAVLEGGNDSYEGRI